MIPISQSWENVSCLIPLLCLCPQVSHKTCRDSKACIMLLHNNTNLCESFCSVYVTHCWVTASEWGLSVPYVLFSSVCLSERPTFLRRPINQVVLEEEAVEFRCQVQGDPQPSVRWKKDEIDVPRGRWDGDTLAEMSANLKHYFKCLLV